MHECSVPAPFHAALPPVRAPFHQLGRCELPPQPAMPQPPTRPDDEQVRVVAPLVLQPGATHSPCPRVPARAHLESV